MKAESLIFRKLTPNEFKAITNTINSEGGGSQTYIDFPKGSISDIEFEEFFDHSGTPNNNGYEWVFYVNSLSLGRNQQKEIISARRDSSNSLREQNNENRIEIWKSERSGFPNENYDDKNNPIIVFIIKSEDKEYWAGWFYRNECTDFWPMSIGLSTMFWKDCAYIKFDNPIPFDTSNFKWPFFKDGNKNQTQKKEQETRQIIYYGAPGTGKSHEVKKQTGELLDSGEKRELPNVFRSTFHPDTDYASFVGCYKPTMKPTTNAAKTLSGKEEEIVYEYVPQVFADAYVYAYQNPSEQTYLVIEEINRGNCAQIFGDLFQLLDRKDGKSEYTIKADKDLAKYLEDELGVDAEGIKDRKLCLPANLHILATMNTSDQSLFPMDSAFKRRWEWEYVPINYAEEIKSGKFEIKIGDKTYSWVKFIEEVNKRIFKLTQSEDKQMGNFFIKHSVDEKEFKSKVMFYLWYEVLRDEVGSTNYFFYKKEAAQFTFKDLYESDATETLQQFMAYLGVSPK